MKKEKNNERDRRKAELNSREQLPGSYGEDCLVLLPVEPYLAHIYWDLSPGKDRLPSKRAQPVLRFHDITGREADEPSRFFDVEVDLRAGSWYVPLWSPGRSYVVELGHRNGKGRFHPLVSSNQADFPPAQPSGETEAEEFMLVMGDAERGVLILREFEEPGEEAELPEAPAVAAEEKSPAGIPAEEEGYEPIPPVPPVFFNPAVSSYMAEREEEQRAEFFERKRFLQAAKEEKKALTVSQAQGEDLIARAERSFGFAARLVPPGYERT